MTFLARDAAVFEFGKDGYALHVRVCKWQRWSGGETLLDALSKQGATQSRSFQCLRRQISTTGSIRGEKQETSRPQNMRTINQVKAILETIEYQPERSTWSITRDQGIHHTTVRHTVGQNRNHAAKNQKIDFFSFRLKLIPHYSKLFIDLSMYNVFVLC